MSSIESRVIAVDHKDIQWPFTGHPYIITLPRHPKAYGYRIEVDPFPCYQHDRDLVVEMVEKVEIAFPLEFLPNYYLLPYEDLGRTNGHANRHHIYTNDDGLPPYEPYIVLSGKRIPLHPAMTRYLIAHEYGHQVHWHIERRLGLKDGDKSFRAQYAERRGIEADFGYGGQKWHSAIGEIIANDFRICVCAVEQEFWPHPGFTHPNDLPDVQAFWQEAVSKYAYTEAAAA